MADVGPCHYYVQCKDNKANDNVPVMIGKCIKLMTMLESSKRQTVITSALFYVCSVATEFMRSLLRLRA